jgi:tetratricopeptide (TPR) repeat protein
MSQPNANILRKWLNSGKSFDRTAVKVPDKSLRHLASEAQDRRDWNLAHELWQKVTVEEPEFAGGWIQLGNMLNELADYPAALAAFKIAQRLDPESYVPAEGMAGVHERAGQWREALAAWLSSIDLLPAGDRERLTYAYSHAILAAHHAQDSQALADVLVLAAQVAPELLQGSSSLALRARLRRSTNAAESKRLFREHLSLKPDDTAALFEVASICLNDGDYATGLQMMQQALQVSPGESSFLWLAADLNERSGRWLEVRRLCDTACLVDEPELRFLQRGFDVAVRLGDLVTARTMARRYARAAGGELKLIDRLREAYELCGELRRARLLCRFLARRWPHSRWHIGQTIILTAATLGLVDADRLTRTYNAKYGPTLEIDRAYCKAGFVSSEHAEAQRRLEWFFETTPEGRNDIETQILFGYVLANSQGLKRAEEHFQRVASRHFREKSALVGLAHMASRQRDSRAIVEQWALTTEMYPEDTIARVEHARAVYNLGNASHARNLCEERLGNVPTDVTMGEFYAWLLVAMGENEAAQRYLPTLYSQGGPSWALFEAYVQSAGRLGLLDNTWRQGLEFLPPSSHRHASNRLYHVARLLMQFEHPQLAAETVEASNIESKLAPWIAPYVQDGRLKINPALAGEATRSWVRIRGHVRDHAAQRLRQMSDAQVQAAILKPRHDHPVVHIINKFEQARGGSELHALDVAAYIARHATVELWAPEMPHPEFSTKHGVQAVDRSQGRAPLEGVFVFIGIYFPISWIAKSRPSRIIFLYNTFEAPQLFDRVEEAYRLTGVRPELLFCSDMMGEDCGLPGLFEPSPTDISLFTAAPRQQQARPFTLGRHSRDVTEKHHPDDGDV